MKEFSSLVVLVDLNLFGSLKQRKDIHNNRFLLPNYDGSGTTSTVRTSTK